MELQYTNSGIRSEAEIEEKHKAYRLAEDRDQLQHGINKHRERDIPIMNTKDEIKRCK